MPTWTIDAQAKRVRKKGQGEEIPEPDGMETGNFRWMRLFGVGKITSGGPLASEKV